MFSVQESYDRLLDSEVFLNRGFLCGAFIMCDPKDLEVSNWQLDFYDNRTKKITSYVIADKVSILELNSEIFKEETSDVEELDLKDVKTDFKKVIKEVKEKVRSRKETINKLIIILQQQDVAVWNVSAFTNTFNLINFKINAKNSKLIDEKIVPLLSWDTGKEQKL